MARTCSFIESLLQWGTKNNAMKGATFYHIPGVEIYPCWVVQKLTIVAVNLLGYGEGYSQMNL